MLSLVADRSVAVCVPNMLDGASGRLCTPTMLKT